MAHDTAPIREDERFDQDKVADYLRAALPELVGDGPIVFDQFPGGAANLTYRAVAGDTELVLRRAPHGPVAERSHDMKREHGVLSRLWKAYTKAPRSYHFCPDPDVLGKPFFVMERRQGWVIRNEWPQPYVGEDDLKRRLAVSLVDGLAELHLVDAHAVGLRDLGRPEGFVERQVDGWTRRWHVAKTREVPAMDEASQRLAVSPGPGPTVILHNDYKFDNMVLDPDELTRIIGILDWEMSTIGDPLMRAWTRARPRCRSGGRSARARAW